ncbi:MAG TPA: hypothetical protein VKE69_08365 [Planctomycetota bacterium]|nr:hypothetical protein [Planctomycetota bacterium]
MSIRWTDAARRVSTGAIAVALAACASSRAPKDFPVREIASGSSSGMPIATQRLFESPEEYERFASGLRGRGDFPPATPRIDWSQEWLVAAFGGPSKTGDRMTVLRARELSGALIVEVRKERGPLADQMLDENGLPTHGQAPAAKTPFVIVALPRYKGPVRFLASSTTDLGGER